MGEVFAQLGAQLGLVLADFGHLWAFSANVERSRSFLGEVTNLVRDFDQVWIDFDRFGAMPANYGASLANFGDG